MNDKTVAKKWIHNKTYKHIKNEPYKKGEKKLSQSPNTLKEHFQLVSHMGQKSYVGEQITHFDKTKRKGNYQISFVPCE